jgi:hypothetical protein
VIVEAGSTCTRQGSLGAAGVSWGCADAVARAAAKWSQAVNSSMAAMNSAGERGNLRMTCEAS